MRLGQWIGLIALLISIYILWQIRPIFFLVFLSAILATALNWKAGAVIVLYFAIQPIEGNFVTPVIMEKQVSLLPAFTLALMTAFGLFFGLLGLFLSLPILVVAQICLKEILIKDVLDKWQEID
ncbi:AI-2E family transporter [Kamptonema formosum]|uniref:AI-2E family transporter n=1 Tax=Kamptonema formosum TaxID=331992 RepID=UPI000349C337|nr:AI-2E family transporter [Oscillatoria sp. PCC 10802]